MCVWGLVINVVCMVVFIFFLNFFWLSDFFFIFMKIGVNVFLLGIIDLWNLLYNWCFNKLLVKLLGFLKVGMKILDSKYII